MGYIKPLSVTRYDFPSDPTYYFDWKSFVSYGDMKTATEAALANAPKNDQGQPVPDNEVAQRYMMCAYIAEWNLDDDAGNVLPITPDNLEALQDVDFSALAALFTERMSAKATERKNSVTSSAV